MEERRASFPRIIIVGAGVSGLCLAIRLKLAGFDDFEVLEASDEIGGTWSKNSYPNAGCDVPSYLYSYSFASKYDWTMKYARQPEILGYLKYCVDRFQIGPHVRLKTSVVSATFHEAERCWQVRTNAGDTLSADFVVSAVGQLNRPRIPPIPGSDSFTGQQWHSARWNHDYDFRGKAVAVIGNGASAIQFVPEIAKLAEKLILVQRTPSWIQTFNNYRYPAWGRWMLRTLPGAVALHRMWIYLQCESRIVAFGEGSKLNQEYARWLRRQMRRKVPAERWSQLIPEYSPGCKRILLSNDYLETLQRPNVKVVSGPVERIEQEAIVTATGNHPVDAIVYATGFKANEFLQPMKIVGRDGRSLEEAWGGRPRGYFGLAMSGFPNLFMLYGPNTNLGHNSIIFMVERQVEWIIRVLRRLQRRGQRTVEVRPQAVAAFDDDVRQRLANSVWAGDCTNWYKSADGSIPNNWSGSATRFWLRLRGRGESDLLFS